VVCVIDRESGGAAKLAEAGLELAPLFTMTELKKAGA
jgi:orotate phosphoribosyltransferase